MPWKELLVFSNASIPKGRGKAFRISVKAPLIVYQRSRESLSKFCQSYINSLPSSYVNIIYAILGTGSRSVECIRDNKFCIEEHVIISFKFRATKPTS